METEPYSRGKILDHKHSGLAECCMKTIDKHVNFNPMMVCDDCRRLIKCFIDKDAYRNYLKFCASRKREVLTAQQGKYYIMSFEGYEPFR